jgi:hypothetical protein
MDIQEWIAYGVEKGFCSEIVCDIHNGVPMLETEMKEFDDGFDPCIFVVRVYSEGRPDSN